MTKGHRVKILILFVMGLIAPCFSDSFESVAIIPGSSEDEVWVVVNRTIDSNTVRYIEVFQPLDWGSDSNDIYFVDSGTDANDSLTHLEGETVVLLGDAIPDPNSYTVSIGAITTYTSHTNETIGLPYTSIYETMPLVKMSQMGSSNSKRIRIINVIIDFYESLACNMGVEGNTSSLQFSEDSFATVLEPVTELKGPIPFVGGWTREPVIYIDVNEPVPLSIRALYPNIEIVED